MKKMIILLFCTSLMFAILPPFYHSTNEIKRILEDPALHAKLGSAQMIHDIIKTDTGYVIITQDYFLEVKVQYIQTGKIGPGEFVLYFGEPMHQSTQNHY